MDYDKLIAPDTWEFIRKTAEYYPEDAVDLDIEGQRRVYDAMCKAFHRPHPAGISTEDRTVDGVPVRIYWAGEPGSTVMYFHGGGFVVGGLESHDDVCAEICAGTGYRVISVDYRLAPEHRHPAAFRDAWKATRWAVDHYDQRVVLVGDSAGGNLAAVLAQDLRGSGLKLAAQLLIYPACDFDKTRPSYFENAEAPLLQVKGMDMVNAMYSPDTAQLHSNPRLAPLLADSLADLPRAFVAVAQNDPLRDSGTAYAEALAAAGVSVTQDPGEGLIHGYLRAMEYCDASRERLKQMADWLRLQY